MPYQKCAPVIKEGVSRTFGQTGQSWRHPQGWQAFLRKGKSLQLLVIHTFQDSPDEITVPIDEGITVVESFSEGQFHSSPGTIRFKPNGNFTGSVSLLIFK